MIPENPGLERVEHWFLERNRKPFRFQREVWDAFAEEKSGLLNAPTGSGKTFALFFPLVIDHLNRQAAGNLPGPGLRLLWITPLRALTNDIAQAMISVCEDLQIPFRVRMRTGDSSAAERKEIKLRPPEILLTTPESLHVMLSQKSYPTVFKNLQAIVIDEWHELLGSKRGVQVELALSRIKAIKKESPAQETLRIWGISATIGNLKEASDVLLGLDEENEEKENRVLIKAEIKKKTEIYSIIPNEIEKYTWSGHLGVKLISQVIPVIELGKTTLLFTNTRSQAEIWYHAVINKYEEFAGIMAMHHGSLGNELRAWVEQSLHSGQLKLVICTSSLDLGVDFRPVDMVIQVGSPKGVARFMQRAGRSGHQPGATSRIYFVPTHSLELVEGAALKRAIANRIYESRDPVIMPMDVLIQYLLTLAVSDGFSSAKLFKEVKGTFAFSDITEKEWDELVFFLTQGGETLQAYDEYRKVRFEDGLYKVTSRKAAMQHRMSIGTIVGATSIRVCLLNGSMLGTIEESFISKLKIGDVFWFAGRSLELLKLKEMTAYVRKIPGTRGQIPSWDGGRMPLSSQLSGVIREIIEEAALNKIKEPELEALIPIFDLQRSTSILPLTTEFLIEKLPSKEGWHLFFFPFEGRLVHEGLASLMAYRLGKRTPATFSIAMSDYGFELLSDVEIPDEHLKDPELFTGKNLLDDILHSLNANEMARRKFRDIAHIAGLVFTGYPGKEMRSRHLQANTSLLFDVFSEYEPDHFLLRQAYREALQYQLEEFRLREALRRISGQTLVLMRQEKPGPLAFPILVDSLSRDKLSTESIEQRVGRMVLQYDPDPEIRDSEKF